MKILAFDLDGTAVTRAQVISPRLREALQTAAQRGIVVVPATGRVHHFLPPVIDELTMTRYIITSNGASVYDKETGSYVFKNLVPNEKTLEVASFLEGEGIYYELYHEGDAITQKGRPEEMMQRLNIPEERKMFFKKQYRLVENLLEFIRTQGIEPEKINLTHVPEPQYARIWQALEGLGDLLVTSSIPGNMELNCATGHKGTALKFLADMLHVPAADVMAAGDGGNDIGMLQYAGISVAMGNGSEEVKAAAKYVTDTCDNDGLAKAIETYLLTD